MAFRKPYLRISGQDGTDIGQRLGRDLVGVQITDLMEGEIDRAMIRLRRTKPYRAAPPVGTVFQIHVGWDEQGAVMTGTYKFMQVLHSGSPQEGEETVLVCEAADFNDSLKRVDSEHFDEETGHKTYGDVIRTMAERVGLDASIDPEIAKIPLAGGYLLRWKQSSIGFVTDIAEELGAIIKPQAGSLTVRRRGSFQTPTGQQLQTITIPRDPNYFFQVDITPRYGFAEVTTPWFDPAAGRPFDTLKALGRGAARFAMPHIVGSEQLATAMSAAAAQRLDAETASGLFQSAGQPYAVAGSPVEPQGFGPDIDNVDWEAVSVVHDIEPEGAGWVTTIETRNAE
ncbi:hypothetical protein [Aureimonas sp. ME7]|uniref:phage late control D family protein n=1 Tax=Aureimonas sp. ME7 TaxID=2744252 RepID=UPI0015F6E752|nr:hypothetical protein [Aureimonas sp. ME7]